MGLSARGVVRGTFNSKLALKGGNAMTKRSMKRGLMILPVAVSLGVSSLSRASTSYSYVAQVQGGTVVDGANNTLNLYLQEVSTGGSFTAASDGGLYAGGVALVEHAGGTGVTFTAAGVSNNGATEPAGFTGNNRSGLFTSGAWITDITNNNASMGVAPISTTSGGTTTSLYLLGSVTVGVGSNPGASFTVESLYDAPTNDGAPGAGADGNTLSYTSGNDLDAGGFSSGVTGADGHPTPFAFPFSTMPEPASLAIFGFASATLLMRRQRQAHG